LGLAAAKDCPPGSPNCGGSLVGFRKGANETDCYVVDIAQPSGRIERAVPFPGCSDRGTASNGVPQDGFRLDGGTIYWISGTGKQIFQVDDASFATTFWGNLPETYNYTVKIHYVAYQGLWQFTTSDLFFYDDTASPPVQIHNPQRVLSLTEYGLSSSTLVAGDEWDTKIYVVNNGNILTVDVSNPTTPLVSTATLALNGNVSCLAVYSDGVNPNQLLILADNNFYLTDPVTGASKFLFPTGPTSGIPYMNTIAADTFFYADDHYFYEAVISALQVANTSPFDTAAMVGFFQFHP